MRRAIHEKTIATIFFTAMRKQLVLVHIFIVLFVKHVLPFDGQFSLCTPQAGISAGKVGRLNHWGVITKSIIDSGAIKLSEVGKFHVRYGCIQHNTRIAPFIVDICHRWRIRWMGTMADCFSTRTIHLPRMSSWNRFDIWRRERSWCQFHWRRSCGSADGRPGWRSSPRSRPCSFYRGFYSCAWHSISKNNPVSTWWPNTHNALRNFP